MKIPEEIIERVKEENDIADVISEYVTLKKSGKNFSGLCPFHNEKSPSFSVSEDKQIFKCFGCGEAGNVISFIMKVRNLNFVDALKYLAERVNINIDFKRGEKDPRDEKKKVLRKINKETARYYFANLQKDPKIKEYFFRRGLTEQTLRSFGIGYAKDGWRETLGFLTGLGLNKDIMKETGLVIFNEEKNSSYDRFRNRVIFPVFDVYGNVIGFGGRVLDDSKPKYLNSPETLIFDKGTNLYGLNFVIKNNGIKDRTMIMVEGYMDCISLHQYGIMNAVASLGTALTVKQGKLLRKYADTVIISYDADLAGQMATLRGLDVLTEVGLDVRVLTIPKGKDPDEFVRVNGKEAFLKLIKNAQKLIEYKLTVSKQGLNLKVQEDLVKYGDRITEVLAKINPVEKDVYIKKISEETGIKEQAIYDLLKAKLSSFNKNNRNMNNTEYYGTKLYIEPAYVKSIRNLFCLMLSESNYEFIKERFSRDDCIDELYKSLYSLAEEIIASKGFEDIYKNLELRCDQADLIKELLKIRELADIGKNLDSENLIKDYIFIIKTHKLKKEQEFVMKKLKDSERLGDIEASLSYLKQSKEVQGKLRSLKK
ncbi:DNA primase [uncultured Clostridium sp.]|uniref:DNA primase n=1 Tax=uncultured Clostridium sp. TaxID=59620 RepID=UPI00260E2757|nr:DNA primase [uncultured Clostridium sp.]